MLSNFHLSLTNLYQLFPLSEMSVWRLFTTKLFSDFKLKKILLCINSAKKYSRKNIDLEELDTIILEKHFVNVLAIE